MKPGCSPAPPRSTRRPRIPSWSRARRPIQAASPCGDDALNRGGVSSAALSTCDATDQDQAKSRWSRRGRSSSPNTRSRRASESFDFSLDDQQFTLKDGGSTTFEDLAPGTYRLTEHVPSGWDIAGLTCADVTDDTEVVTAEGTAVIDLAEGETVSCEYTNVADSAEPNEPGEPNEPSGTETLGETGAPRWTNLLITLGVLLASSGAGLMTYARHRRIG